MMGGLYRDKFVDALRDGAALSREALCDAWDIRR